MAVGGGLTCELFVSRQTVSLRRRLIATAALAPSARATAMSKTSPEASKASVQAALVRLARNLFSSAEPLRCGCLSRWRGGESATALLGCAHPRSDVSSIVTVRTARSNARFRQEHTTPTTPTETPLVKLTTDADLIGASLHCKRRPKKQAATAKGSDELGVPHFVLSCFRPFRSPQAKGGTPCRTPSPKPHADRFTSSL